MAGREAGETKTQRERTIQFVQVSKGFSLVFSVQTVAQDSWTAGKLRGSAGN